LCGGIRSHQSRSLFQWARSGSPPMASAATTFTTKDGTTVLTGPMSLATYEAMALDFDGEPWFTGSVNTNFIVNSSAAVQVSGRVYFIQS
jgi:hypothetical protein